MPLAALGPILAGTAGAAGAAATTGAWTAIGAGALGATQLIGASKQAGAAQKAAAITSAATTKGAELQAESQRQQLEFTKAEAERQRLADEATRRANYEQWAAGQRRHGTLAQLLGLPDPEIPGYVPGYTPGTLGAASGMPASGTSPTTPAGPAQNAPQGDYQGWFMSQIAGKPFNQQTLLDLEPTLQAAGFKLTPPNAAGERTKIQLPTGQWVRVGFGEGKPVWVPQPMAAQSAPAGYTDISQNIPGTLMAAYGARPLLTPPIYQPGTLGYGLRG